MPTSTWIWISKGLVIETVAAAGAIWMMAPVGVGVGIKVDVKDIIASLRREQAKGHREESRPLSGRQVSAASAAAALFGTSATSALRPLIILTIGRPSFHLIEYIKGTSNEAERLAAENRSHRARRHGCPQNFGNWETWSIARQVLLEDPNELFRLGGQLWRRRQLAKFVGVKPYELAPGADVDLHRTFSAPAFDGMHRRTARGALACRVSVCHCCAP